MGEEHTTEAPLAPQNILDKVTFGRRLRALRVLREYDRVSDLTAVLRGRYGVEVSDRSLYAVERGEQMPGLDLFFALCAILRPDASYFEACLRADVAQALKGVAG